MIGNIILPYKAPVIPPPDPDDYFDPTTHIATEADFIAFLEKGYYTEDVIGYKVQLGTGGSVYDNGIWIIADVNHDSEHTGQTDCYDLISQDVIWQGAFGNNDGYWRNSRGRNWFNGTWYNYLSSDFRARMIMPKYKWENTWYNDDYIIAPSKIEVGGDTTETNYVEGIAYPIFTDNNSRKKYAFGTSTYSPWWTRTYNSYNSNNLFVVSDTGYPGSVVPYSSSTYYWCLIMRVH